MEFRKALFLLATLVATVTIYATPQHSRAKEPVQPRVLFKNVCVSDGRSDTPAVGQGCFGAIHLYSPTEAFFDKAWKADNITNLKEVTK